MKYLVLLTPGAGAKMDDFRPHLVPEIKAVWAAYLAGRLREFYYSEDPQTVTLVYELADRAAVEREINALPLVEVGLLDRKVVPLGPFPQFQLLFDKELN